VYVFFDTQSLSLGSTCFTLTLPASTTDSVSVLLVLPKLLRLYFIYKSILLLFILYILELLSPLSQSQATPTYFFSLLCKSF